MFLWPPARRLHQFLLLLLLLLHLPILLLQVLMQAMLVANICSKELLYCRHVNQFFPPSPIYMGSFPRSGMPSPICAPQHQKRGKKHYRKKKKNLNLAGHNNDVPISQSISQSVIQIIRQLSNRLFTQKVSKI